MDIKNNKNPVNENQKSKRVLAIFVTLMIILMIVVAILYAYTTNIKKKLLKVYIDGSSWFMSGNDTKVAVKRLSSNSIIKEGGKNYFGVQDFAELAGFRFYRGDRTTEDESKAYIENDAERVTFVSGSKEIRKYSLLSSYVTGKNTGLTSQVFNIGDSILFKNGKLYISEDGFGRAFNLLFKYDSSNNIIRIYTLEYFYSQTAAKVKDIFKADSYSDGKSKVLVDNKKALLYNYVIDYDEATGLYGMALLSNPSKLVISKKYKQIDYVEGSDDFIVTTEDGKVGILGKDSVAKVAPKYESIENIDLNSGLYLVKLDGKYGVVTQMGKNIVTTDYDQVGLDLNIDDKNLTSRYLIYDNCIPVKRAGKWGMFDRNGNKILDLVYDFIGCPTVQVADANAQPVVVIPDINGIVIGQRISVGNDLSNSRNVFGVVDKTGQPMVNMTATSFYKVTFEGVTKYYYYADNLNIDIVDAWRKAQKEKENAAVSGTAGVQNDNVNQVSGTQGSVQGEPIVSQGEGKNIDKKAENSQNPVDQNNVTGGGSNQDGQVQSSQGLSNDSIQGNSDNQQVKSSNDGEESQNPVVKPVQMSIN